MRAHPGLRGPLVFDAERAVRDFQRRHGLEPDGVVGPGTRAALNTSAARRAQQIALNMERWRWVPDRLGAVHCRVNVPEFRLSLHEEGRETLSSRVIVGRSNWATPALRYGWALTVAV